MKSVNSTLYSELQTTVRLNVFDNIIKSIGSPNLFYMIKSKVTVPSIYPRGVLNSVRSFTRAALMCGSK